MRLDWITSMVAAIALAGVAQAQGPQGAAPPGPDKPARQAAMTSDLTLLLALNARQQAALSAYLEAIAPPPPERLAGGPMPGGPRRPDHAMAPPPPHGSQNFLEQLNGPPKPPEMEQREKARSAAGRAFWNALDSGQRTRLDALARLHALPMGGPPMGPMGRPPMPGGPLQPGF